MRNRSFCWKCYFQKALNISVESNIYVCTWLHKEVTGMSFSLCHIRIYGIYRHWLNFQAADVREVVCAAIDSINREFSGGRQQKSKTENSVVIICRFWNRWIGFLVTLRTCITSIASSTIPGCDTRNQDEGFFLFSQIQNDFSNLYILSEKQDCGN